MACGLPVDASNQTYKSSNFRQIWAKIEATEDAGAHSSKHKIFHVQDCDIAGPVNT